MAQLVFNYDPGPKALLVQFIDPAQGTPQAPKVLDSVPIAPQELDGFLAYVTQAVNWVKTQAGGGAPAAKFADDVGPGPSPVSTGGDAPAPARRLLQRQAPKMLSSKS